MNNKRKILLLWLFLLLLIAWIAVIPDFIADVRIIALMSSIYGILFGIWIASLFFKMHHISKQRRKSLVSGRDGIMHLLTPAELWGKKK